MNESIAKQIREKLLKKDEEKKYDILDILAIYIINFQTRGSFNLKDKVFFFRELSFLLRGGIGIVQALEIIKSFTNNPKVVYIVNEIYDAIKKGESFSKSLMRLPKYFNEGDIATLRGAEETGNLPEVLEYLALQYEFLFEVKKKYFGAMLYPLILIILSIIAIVVLNFYILPNILQLIKDINIEIPWYTKLLLDLSLFMKNNYLQIFIIFLFIIFGILIYFSTEDGKKVKDKLIFTIPIFGRLTLIYFLIKFLRYFRLFYNAGLNYIAIFNNLNNIMGNYIYSLMIDEILNNIRKGDSPFDAMKSYFIIPKDALAILKTGEQSASLDEAAKNASYLYEVEFNEKINNFSKIIEPIMLIFVGVIVLWIAMSVIGVLITILESVNQF